MAPSPLPLAIIIIGTLVFEAMLYGGAVAEAAFPTFEQPSSGGFFGALDALLAVVQGVWGVVEFIWGLVTFNVPGAPIEARVIVGGIFGIGIIVFIAMLIRGN